MNGRRVLLVVILGLGVLAVVLTMISMTGEPSGSATSSTTEAMPVFVVSAWDGLAVTSLCVDTVEEYFDLWESEPVEGITPVQDGVVAAFRDNRMPVEIVADGCDATIQVRVEGQAVSDEYIGVAGRLYTGARVTGTLTLVAPGRPSLRAQLEGDEPTAGGVQGPDVESVRTPDGAPFWEAVNADACAALVDWFRESDELLLALLARDAMRSSDGSVITGDCPGYAPSSMQG